MMRFMTPKQALRLASQSAQMLIEAQRVIALRVAGMGGSWNVAADENIRMVTEKQQAMIAASQAMILATARGGSAGAVALAGLKPLRARTRANAARLTKAGPKLPRTR
ncbi:MAG: antifreeze protein [Alphaproteobacteria bacterium]|jgi:hypothetical protein